VERIVKGPGLSLVAASAFVAQVVVVSAGCGARTPATTTAPTAIPVTSVAKPPPKELLPAVPEAAPPARPPDGKTRAAVARAATDARVLHPIVELWRINHATQPCPTLEDLVRDKEVNPRSSFDDPWGQRYAILCDDEETRVVSAGPDGRFGTEDDVVVPEPPPPP